MRKPITKPGVYRIDADAYHADPCAVPSLSHSLIQVLLDRTPAHARLAHPKLNPKFEAEPPTTEQAFGQAAHAMITGEGDRLMPIKAPSWRKTWTQYRAIQAKGKKRIPVLEKDHRRIGRMAARFLRWRAQLPRDLQMDLSGGEQTMIWREGDPPIWCRIRPDLLSILVEKRAATIWDYKTAPDANPDVWSARTLYQTGADIEAAFYIRGFQALHPEIEEIDFRFVVQERDPPHEIAVIALGPAADHGARQRIDRAVAIWRRCMIADDWPGYPALVHYVDEPNWVAERDQGRAARWEFLERMAAGPMPPMREDA